VEVRVFSSAPIFSKFKEFVFFLEFRGKVNCSTMHGRLKAHWTPEDAVTRPILKDIELEVDGKEILKNEC